LTQAGIYQIQNANLERSPMTRFGVLHHDLPLRAPRKCRFLRSRGGHRGARAIAARERRRPHVLRNNLTQHGRLRQRLQHEVVPDRVERRPDPVAVRRDAGGFSMKSTISGAFTP